MTHTRYGKHRDTLRIERAFPQPVIAFDAGDFVGLRHEYRCVGEQHTTGGVAGQHSVAPRDHFNTVSDSVSQINIRVGEKCSSMSANSTGLRLIKGVKSINAPLSELRTQTVESRGLNHSRKKRFAGGNAALLLSIYTITSVIIIKGAGGRYRKRNYACYGTHHDINLLLIPIELRTRDVFFVPLSHMNGCAVL